MLRPIPLLIPSLGKLFYWILPNSSICHLDRMEVVCYHEPSVGGEKHCLLDKREWGSASTVFFFYFLAQGQWGNIYFYARVFCCSSKQLHNCFITTMPAVWTWSSFLLSTLDRLIIGWKAVQRRDYLIIYIWTRAQNLLMSSSLKNAPKSRDR